MADDISKLCSDHLRQCYPGLKASHARELVAAFFGYKSHAALLSEQTYNVNALNEAAVLIPAVSLFDHRKTNLEGLPATVQPGSKISEQIVIFLRDKELFAGESWICESLGMYMIEDYLPKELSGTLDNYLADSIAETNAYFEDHEYKKAEIEDGKNTLTVKVEGTFYGEMDPNADRMFCGDTIDFVATVELHRVAGRIGFMEPEIDASGAVRRDYYDSSDFEEEEEEESLIIKLGNPQQRGEKEMAEHQRVAPITLTDKEKQLYDSIPAPSTLLHTHLGPEKWSKIADSMESLLDMLLDRKAIHPKRIAVFNDARYAETGNKSTKEIFERNGTSGNEIIRHPHFIEFLRYFINGPDLPEEAITGLLEVLDSIATSGMIVTRSQKHVRDMVRKHNLDRSHAGTEFFRLAVEIGMSPTKASGLRKAAKSVR